MPVDAAGPALGSVSVSPPGTPRARPRSPETSFTLVTPSITVTRARLPAVRGHDDDHHLVAQPAAERHRAHRAEPRRRRHVRDARGRRAHHQRAPAASTGPSPVRPRPARGRVTPNGSLPASRQHQQLRDPRADADRHGADARHHLVHDIAVRRLDAQRRGATVRIELSRDGGATFETIVASAPNTGTFSGSRVGPRHDARLDSRHDQRLGDRHRHQRTASRSSQPTLAVTSPRLAPRLRGTPLAITWSTNLPASSPVAVELSRDGGSTYEILAAALPTRAAWLDRHGAGHGRRASFA